MNFAEIIELLEESLDHYWLDSGSLLGLVREGQLLEWDSDIDFGILSSEIPSLLLLNDRLKEKKIRTSKRIWKGRVYGTTLHFRKTKPVHFHVFWAQEDTAWSPQTISYYNSKVLDIGGKSPPYPITRTVLQHVRRLGSAPYGHIRIWRSFKARIVRRLWKLFMRLRGRHPREVWANTYPYKSIHEIATWKIPAHHFETLERKQIGEVLVPIPSLVEDYLTLRYGDWSTPQKKWIYWLDDKALHEGPPDIHGFTTT